MATPATARLDAYRQRVNTNLEQLLGSQAANGGNIVLSAMQHAVHAGGKRLRPLLVYASGELIQVQPARLDAAAAAIELIHSYSLVHDDLPAMDDDDLRRGQPSCHIAFGEANAILAGDALQALAFQQLAENHQAEAEQNLTAIGILSKAAGVQGMVLGQALDLQFESQRPDQAGLEQMFRLKTGALLQAAIDMACCYSPQLGEGQRTALQAFGLNIGLAFQIQDDILDVVSDTETLGKPQGSDQAQDKASYPSLFGLDASRQRVQALLQQALSALEPFNQAAELLQLLARRLVKRQS